MKNSEFIKQVEAGKPVVKAEWRSGEAKSFTGVDNGRAYTSLSYVHNIEMDGRAMTLRQKLEGVNPAIYQPGVKKGDIVAITLDIAEAAKGGFWVRAASVEKIEA